MKLREFKNSSSDVNLLFIPGGPGLSSLSFEKLMTLKENYSLYFFNPMGTTTKLEVIPNYTNLLNEIKDVVQKLDNVVLCGHSFGGIQAIDIAADNLKNVKGLIVMGTPVTENAFSIVAKNFKTGITDKHSAISKELDNNPTDKLYKEWFNVYRDFYFNPEKSSEHVSVITDDSVCIKSYIEALEEASQKSERLLKLKDMNIPKLFITGELDMVMPPVSAQFEANSGGFDLEIVDKAGHFVHYECPTETIEIINRFLS